MQEVSHGVRLFTSDNYADLEYMINDFLQYLDKSDVKYSVDFKYSTSFANDSIGTVKSKHYSCLVIVTELKEMEAKS